MPGPAQIHAVLRQVIPCESPSDVISPRIASAVFTVIPIISAISVEERTGALPARQFTRLFPDPAIRFHGSHGLRQPEVRTPRVAELGLTPSHRLQPRSKDFGPQGGQDRAWGISLPLNTI
ncbi:hypothetical protein CJ301_14515 [Limimaricola cinnabarinus]|uniref:Uncharacterized protein n=1 Tax=Limimaricola cinnabarinus TaxID=1125964 RepID=A0A2G1MDL4_9RHOB|nr:hypothetical protein CJ301_14515 [Limimaricola cinnabarinus]